MSERARISPTMAIIPLLLLLLLSLFNSTRLVHSASISSDAQALLLFKSKTDSAGGLRFFSAAAHCHWPGITCNGVRVTHLVLENVGLSGEIPNGTLDRLDQLRVLSLKSNNLSGPIPNTLSKLLNLKTLYLSNNHFTGGIPNSLLLLHRLRKLDLSHNRLNGAIPRGISALDRLYVLRLESNDLTGPLPSINITSLDSFNVSDNNLSGPVPITRTFSSAGPSAFIGNPRLCGVLVKKECSNSTFFRHSNYSSQAPAIIPGQQQQQQQLQGVLLESPESPSRKHHHRKAIIAVYFLVGVVLMIGAVAVSLALRKKKGRISQGNLLSPEKSNGSAAPNEAIMCMEESSTQLVDSDGMTNELAAAAAMSEDKVKKLGKSGTLLFCAGEAPVYTLEQLMRASAEMLGKGSVGTTYKAVLDNRLIVCVKRLDAAKLGMTGKEMFERHLDTVGRLRHPNLVPLRAFFQAKEERLLVYDYQPNGSLFSLIHGSRSSRARPLHWTSCLKIAEDVAQGLSYIHQASRLVHGNVKSSNVLLGSDFEACLADSCLAFLAEPSQGEDDSGYRAPETRKSNRRLTAKSDIYAFGMLLLELLSGKPPLQHPTLIATDLPVWVRSMREDDAAEDERLMLLVDIAAACVRSSPESRPTTWQVIKMIQEVKEVETGDNDLDPTFIS